MGNLIGIGRFMMPSLIFLPDTIDEKRKMTQSYTAAMGDLILISSGTSFRHLTHYDLQVLDKSPMAAVYYATWYDLFSLFTTPN